MIKRKLLISFSAFFMSCMIGGCTQTKHKHEYIYQEFIEPTKSQQGYDLYKCSCGKTKKVNKTGLINLPKDNNKPLNILFIGNSYTYYNELWNIFKDISISQGFDVKVDQVTNGGWSLAQMNDENDTYGAKVKLKLQTNKYDFVFLQEMSMRPANEPALFYDSVRSLSKKIKDTGATPILYATWGRKAGNSALAVNNLTDYSMYQKVISAYKAIGEELNIKVSYVGTAFYDVYKNNPAIDIYDEDKTHPSLYGSYLAGMVHYATLFGLSPFGMNAKLIEKYEIQKVLEIAAHNAAFFGPKIEKQYITSSIGVTTIK